VELSNGPLVVLHGGQVSGTE